MKVIEVHFDVCAFEKLSSINLGVSVVAGSGFVFASDSPRIVSSSL
jgi:hypothetical protein